MAGTPRKTGKMDPLLSQDDDTDSHQDKDDVQRKPMPPKRLQPLLQTDPAGITTKVTLGPLNRTG